MDLRFYPTTTTAVTTHIIVTTHMLTLTNAELEAMVETEVADNPALEMAEPQRCRRCGALIERPPCPFCLLELLKPAVNVESGLRPAPSAPVGDDDYDPLQHVVEPVRLADHILHQLRPQLSPCEIQVAAYLAESLDEKGFLATTAGQAAAMLGVSVAEVERVLAKMHQVDPVGVGTTNARECLLCQLEALPPAVNGVDLLRPVARLLLGEYWDLFLHARWSEIPVPSQQLSAAIAFIRANLTPYPALAGWEGEMARRQSPVEPTVYTRPDAVVYQDAAGQLAVEILSIGPRWLRLNPCFRQLVRSANGNGREEWLAEVERARLFIKCLGQRYQTLSRAVEALVSYQAKAIREGDAFIAPLTRTQLAQMLDLHEATISRAISGKTMALPGGRIVPLAHYFESGKSIKEMIRQMIAGEKTPLSDSEIAKRLAATGQPIARRTVAKYRTMLGILPVHLRVRQKEPSPL